MAQIQSLRNGVSLVTGDRRDLGIGDVVTLQLDSTVGITTFAWSLISRPEFSVAGGPAGPEPTSLGSLATATFTVDVDNIPDDVKLDGTYEVQVILNDGSPTRQVLRARLSRVTGATIPGPGGGTLDLRRPATFELFEGGDIARTWKNDVARWLDRVRRDIGGGPSVDPMLITLNAAMTIGIGDPVAVTAAGTGEKAGAAVGKNPNIIGVALTAAVAPNPFQVRLGGDVTVNTAGLTTGGKTYLSTTGSFTNSAVFASGESRVFVGVALASNRVALVITEAVLIA